MLYIYTHWQNEYGAGFTFPADLFRRLPKYCQAGIRRRRYNMIITILTIFCDLSDNNLVTETTVFDFCWGNRQAILMPDARFTHPFH
jgi:hypothetical protein